MSISLSAVTMMKGVVLNWGLARTALRSSMPFISGMFQSHITRLENTVRWRWHAGDVAIWDNTATQHCAVNDYGDQKRVVRRSTVKGEAPVSVDGRRSVMRSETARQAQLPPAA